jgi:predicted permease
MLQNYFVIAFRNLVRNRTFSTINIIGLSVGIACCLLIFLVVRFHTSFDKHHTKYDRIYGAVTESKYPDGQWTNPGIAGPFSKNFRADIGQVEKVARIRNIGGGNLLTVVENGQLSNKKFIEKRGVCAVEPDFFEIFDLPILSGGDPKKIMTEPNKLIMTEKMAVKYFGDWRLAIGKTIKIDNFYDVTVAGVMANYPDNTDFRLDFLLSFKSLEIVPKNKHMFEQWTSTSSNDRVYFTIPANSNIANIAKLMPAFTKKYLPKPEPGHKTNFLFQPLSIAHFDEKFSSFSYSQFKYSTVYSLALVGFLILFMACINFINLTTAQSIKRSKEVGIRKVMGSGRGELVRQFLGETFLIVCVAVVLSLLLAELSIPFMKHVIDVPDSMPLLSDPLVWIFILITIFLVTFLAGFYPAMVLSGFDPITALKSKIFTQRVGGLSLRRVLVVLQFGIAQLLVIATVVALSQMDYIRKADLGIKPDAILLLGNPTQDSVHRLRFEGIKQQIAQLSGVKSVSFASDVPSSDNNWSSNVAYNNNTKDVNFQIYQKFTDHDFFETYGIKFLAGHTFIKSDTIREFVINETLMKKLGVKNPNVIIGKTLRLGGEGPFKKIVGVVKDFNTNSLREEIKPIMIGSEFGTYYTIGVKLQPQNIDKTASQIKTIWDKAYPEYVYEQSFYDEQIADFYRSEDQISLLFRIFAGIAIFISCLGLYGLVSFMAVQRMKEIGVRKVLGASISQIVIMFSGEFVIMVLLAFLIAAPTGYYLMKEWLSAFAFKISLGVGIFVIALLASLLMAVLTMGYRAYKAAIANPVTSLRSE